MAYSEAAKAQRRCKATRKDGQPCQAYAVWGGEYCSSHTHATRRTLPRGYREWPTRYTPCTCVAYAWPHRPGGGLCRWPDTPLYRRTTPAGTHSDMRTYKRRYRALMRRYGMGV